MQFGNFLKTPWLVVALGLAWAGPVRAGDTAKVITKQNAIRKECRFFAPVVVTVAFDDELEVLSSQGDWFAVKKGVDQGCIHQSAIKKKSFSLSGILGSGGATSSDEVAMAGKGFDPLVEASFKKQHPELDFQAVDRVEADNVPEADLLTFIQEGGLRKPQ